MYADKGSIPGVIRAALNRPDTNMKADDYIKLMQDEKPLSKAWHRRREQAIFAGLPMLIRLRRGLPPLPQQTDLDLYMTGVESIVKSLAPNEIGEVKFNPERGSFYNFHRRYGAYVVMRDQHVMLSSIASISSGQVNSILSKTFRKDAKQEGRESFEITRALFRSKRFHSLSPMDNEDEESSARLIIEGAISKPDELLASVALLHDARNLSQKWRIGIDETIKRLSWDQRFCYDLPVFRALTGYYTFVLPPRMIEDVVLHFGLTRRSATDAVARVIQRLASELSVDETRLRDIIYALVDYELAKNGIDGTELPRSRLSVAVY